MKERRLTKWLQAGYPQFKKNSRVPAWILPERSFAVVVDNLGDTMVLESSRCLGLSTDKAKEMPDYDGSAAGMWQEACLGWPHLSLVTAVITSLLDSVDRVMTKLRG